MNIDAGRSDQRLRTGLLGVLAALRSNRRCLVRKSFPLEFIFGAAELFTEGCGELLLALLTLG